MISTTPRKKNVALFPLEILNNHYCGPLVGTIHEHSGVVNVFSSSMINSQIPSIQICELTPIEKQDDESKTTAFWKEGKIYFRYNGVDFDVQYYDLTQNVFSRNTGILESDVMSEKRAVILGCGSVGSLIALELARSGVGHFLLIDNDIIEYHNLCRHQCSISDVGEYKVDAVKKRIQEINPEANVKTVISVAEYVRKEIFDSFCVENNTIIIGCADNRQADVYGNNLAVYYKVAFISIGFWERAFAGEIFYYLPGANMPCYKCALGDGSGLSARSSANRRVYTTEENLNDVRFEPGISVDINFVTAIGVKLCLDILNRNNPEFTPRLIDSLTQYTLVCNTNKTSIGGDMAELFSYPLQVTTSLKVGFRESCPPCEFER